VRFETSQSMKLGQQMKLAPRMIQSMEILQMPLAQLEERIAQELESNPTLEPVEGNADAPAPQAGEPDAGSDTRPLRIDATSAQDDFARLDTFEHDTPDASANTFDDAPAPRSHAAEPSEYESRSPAPRDGGDERLDAYALEPAREDSLADQLRDQWALCEVDEQTRGDGERILAFIEEDGSLKTPLETIAQRGPAGVSAQRLEHALRALQLFLEPPGVVARTPQEALLLQLDALGETGGASPDDLRHARLLVRDHLDDLMHNRLPRVIEKTGLSMDQLRSALMVLKKLSPAPGRALVQRRERPIVPDAIVEHDEASGRYYAYLNERSLPALRVNEEYARLSKDKAVPAKDRAFLKTNLANASWLLDALRQRRGTLLRVVEKVVEHQRAFFDDGPQALRPLPMTQIAEELGVHPATVSRAVAEKFIATPRGVVPLRKFFSGGLSTDEGEAKAWDAVKEALREVVQAEDKAKPWSDEALVEQLKARGIDIARRTVAKYREQLGIPPARLRKQY
jgi:RNA polymerase sigma-54 factor